MNKLVKISELAIKLNLIDPLTKKPQNHVLRFWEKEFKVIKPKKINNQRYYTEDQVKIIEMIKFLLKNKGMTIAGVKNLIIEAIFEIPFLNQVIDDLLIFYYLLEFV